MVEYFTVIHNFHRTAKRKWIFCSEADTKHRY